MGVLQIVRIFIIPMQASNAVVVLNEAERAVMETPQFIRVVVFLVTSSVFCIAAGVIGIIKSSILKAYTAELNLQSK